MSKLQAIGINERIQTLDVIRGIAILGIFIVNIFDFSGSAFNMKQMTLWTDSSNTFVIHIMKFLAEGGFYTLFSLLFGFGAAIFYERSLAKGVSFRYYFSRRLVALLIFGVLHACFIWTGDILFIYACLGFVIMLMLKWDGTILLRIGIGLLLIDVIIIATIFILQPDAKTVSATLEMRKMLAHYLSHYSHGTWWEITKFRFESWSSKSLSIGMILLSFTTILPMFLIGAAFCKKRWLHTATQHRRAWWTLFAISGVVAVVTRFSVFLDSEAKVLEFIRILIGGPALAFTSLAAITLAMTTANGQKLLAPFSYVGRMALTNYLLQSIVSTTIFYHYGLNYFGKLQPVHVALYVIVFYSVQVVLSRLWLSRFKQGPFETVWRYLTYGRKVKSQVVQKAS